MWVLIDLSGFLELEFDAFLSTLVFLAPRGVVVRGRQILRWSCAEPRVCAAMGARMLCAGSRWTGARCVVPWCLLAAASFGEVFGGTGQRAHARGLFRQILDQRFTDFGLAYGKHLRWVGISPKCVECPLILLYAI